MPADPAALKKLTVTMMNELLNKVCGSLQNNSHMNPLQAASLQSIYKTLTTNEVLKLNADDLADLYFTLNYIFRLSSRESDVNGFKDEVKKFFNLRENMLKGDSKDYCYSDSLANQFCYAIANILFPDTAPLNILLENTLTKDRTLPWFNPYTLDNDLSKSGQGYFRTHDNQIHFYEGVVVRAIAELKRGATQLSDIWLGTDNKLGKVRPLTEDELAIIKQRTPTLGKLVDYSIKLSLFSNGSIFDHFSDLDFGLQHGRSYGEAKIAAYDAMAKFHDWWDLQDENIKSKIRKVVPVVDQLKNRYNYCVDYIRNELQLNDQIRLQLNMIAPNERKDTRISEQMLDEWQQSILTELNSVKRIHTKKNVFETLLNSKSLDRIRFYLNFGFSYDLGSVIVHAKRDDEWQCIKNFLKSEQVGILPIFINSLERLKDPQDVISTLHKFVELTDATRLDAHHISTGEEWVNSKHHLSSEALKLLKLSQQKILQLASKQVYSNDTGIKNLLKIKPHFSFSNLFKKHDSPLKQYENLKFNLQNINNHSTTDHHEKKSGFHLFGLGKVKT